MVRNFRTSLNNKEGKQMKKSDLKTVMWVEYRSGKKVIVLLNTENGDVLVGGGRWNSLYHYDENLNCSFSSECDIVSAYIHGCSADALTFEGAEKIWQREETIEMTIEEACKKLREVTGKPIKITI